MVSTCGMCQGCQSELRWHSWTPAFLSPWILHVFHAWCPAPAVPNHPRRQRRALGPRIFISQHGRTWLAGCAWSFTFFTILLGLAQPQHCHLKKIIINLVFKIKKEIAAFLSQTHFLWCFPGLIETRQAAGMEEASLPCVGAEFRVENGSFVQGWEEVVGTGLPPPNSGKKES